VSRGFEGAVLESELNLIRVELIDDPATIAEVGFEARCDGDDLICRRCGDATRAVVAILVVPAGGHARWALCANCLLEMP
jgi:hypothetical protein